MSYPHPLPPPPNFRVLSIESGSIRLSWSDYPVEVKLNRKIKGYRLYKSSVRNELGKRLADENVLIPGTFQYDVHEPDIGPDIFYTLVAVEESGFGKGGFGVGAYANPDTGGFHLMPYNTRPFGSPVRGFGESPYGIEAYGY